MKGPDLNLPILQRFFKKMKPVSHLIEKQPEHLGMGSSWSFGAQGITVVNPEIKTRKEGDKEIEYLTGEYEVEVFPWVLFEKDFDSTVLHALLKSVRQHICSETGIIS